MPGREDRIANAARRARLGLRDRLGALHRRPRSRLTTATTSGPRSSPTRSGGATSRPWARPLRSGLFDILAHPDLVKVWGPERPASRRRPARASTSSRWTGSPTSDVAIEVSTAGLRKPVGEIYPAPRVPRDVPGGRQAGGAVVGCTRARADRLRLRRGPRAAGRAAGSTEIARVRAARSAARCRSDEPRSGIGYDSTGSGGPAAGPRRRRDPGRARARRALRRRRASRTPLIDAAAGRRRPR